MFRFAVQIQEWRTNVCSPPWHFCVQLEQKTNDVELSCESRSVQTGDKDCWVGRAWEQEMHQTHRIKLPLGREEQCLSPSRSLCGERQGKTTQLLPHELWEAPSLVGSCFEEACQLSGPNCQTTHSGSMSEETVTRSLSPVSVFGYL